MNVRMSEENEQLYYELKVSAVFHVRRSLHWKNVPINEEKIELRIVRRSNFQVHIVCEDMIMSW